MQQQQDVTAGNRCSGSKLAAPACQSDQADDVFVSDAVDAGTCLVAINDD